MMILHNGLTYFEIDPKTNRETYTLFYPVSSLPIRSMKISDKLKP